MPDTKKKPTHKEYMCSRCGVKTTKLISAGRPAPGNCPKSPRKVHTWVVNRKY